MHSLGFLLFRVCFMFALIVKLAKGKQIRDSLFIDVTVLLLQEYLMVGLSEIDFPLKINEKVGNENG